MENSWNKVLERLRKYDTATICNVIELFDVRPRNAGYMDARVVAAFPEMPPMVGFASTATFRSSAPPRAGDVTSNFETQIDRFAELPGPAVVVFQDIDSPSVGATCGDIMCTAYQAFGAVGLVTSGAGRDLSQIRKIGFPLFTNGVICSHAYSCVLQLHVPVHVGGLVVNPGDLLHGDGNGVTAIPKEIAAEVADLADDFIVSETMTLQRLNTRPLDSAQLRKQRAEAKAYLDKLRARVSRAGKV
jgi:regulator of RNase E activity RraA